MAQATVHTKQMADDEVPIREIQTATVRRREYQTGDSYAVSLTRAIRAAGLEDGGSFRFDPDAVDELGVVPALGSEEVPDRPRNSLMRKILKEGTGGKTLRLHIPEQALEAIPGFPPIEEIDWDDPPELSVWAGDRMLAFELAESRSVTIDRGAGEDDDGGNAEDGDDQEETDG